MRGSGRSDDDYRDEIEEHIELEVQANIDRGLSPAEARRAARAAFGSMTAVRQRLREGRTGYWRSALAQGIRNGARMIRRSPLMSVSVVAIMSLGIGSTTAVFAVMNAIAFAAPVGDPESFVQFVAADEGSGYQTATTARYETLSRETRSMRELAAWSVFPLSAPVGSTDAARVQGMLVSCNLFAVFAGGPPIAGRFLQDDDCVAAAPVAVISRRFWQTRFGGDPGVVGTSLVYGTHSLTVVGVAAPSSQPPDSYADLWLPYTIRSQIKDLVPFGDGLDRDDFYWLGMAGRLAPGSSRAAAAAEFRVLASREQPRDPDESVGLALTNGSLWSIAPVETLWMFSTGLAFPTLVTLIVCATVATLLLSRAVGRQREMAIRLALGGGRWGLVRMLLAENLLLAAIAAIVGLGLVYALPPIVLRLGFLTASAVSPATIHPDWRVIAYMAAVTCFTALCAGLAPALESLNVTLGETLKGRQVLSGHRGITVTRGLLVGIQVAFSMVLLVAAVAVVRAERRLADPGFETRQVVFAEIPQQLSPAHTPSSLAARLEGLPGARSAAYAESLPLVFENAVRLQGPRQPESILSATVSPRYFEVFGIRILAGRPFENADAFRKGGAAPIVVSEQFARRFLPGVNPLGKVLREAGGERSFEVVGIAANRAAGFGPLLAVNDGTFVYRLMESSLKGYLVVRFDGDSRAFEAALESVLQSETGRIVQVSTVESSLEARMLRLRGFETLLAAMAAIGLALALVGVFGILAFSAAQRRKEMAIRAALGARRSHIFTTIVLPALRPTGIGIAAGAFLSFAALRVAESQRMVVLGLPSVDPVAYLAGGLVLLSAALAAMSRPAYRAAVSDPSAALRED